ncbi:allatostatins MIP [Scaptodrosophila lebanonensis]|uniref:Allatostatins MIP n=1 Tax=Drosophila lebanonensis TaxID=7225 RepID=A0A6J2UFT4_DROLE|nr:allatostatins MIP [Scaptodrosophila lebanonensis]
MTFNVSFNFKTSSCIISLLLMLLSCLQSLAASSDSAALSDQVVDQLSETDLYSDKNKRAWQSLQSSWGKRGEAAPLDADETLFVTGHFVPLVITDGTNTLDWNTFEHLASGNQEQQSPQQIQQQTQLSNEETDLSGEANTVDKRAWKNMNVAWGKRRQAQGWNKFRGAWGKREPTWNNLKGMWGKRDPWQKLHAGWGKRALMN